MALRVSACDGAQKRCIAGKSVQHTTAGWKIAESHNKHKDFLKGFRTPRLLEIICVLLSLAVSGQGVQFRVQRNCASLNILALKHRCMPEIQ